MDPICEAIAEKRLLRVWYNGGYRVIEPYCHGRSRTGRWVLRAFQVRGFSKSARYPPWKLLDIARMQKLEVLDETFKVKRPYARPYDRGMGTIHCIARFEGEGSEPVADPDAPRTERIEYDDSEE